MARKSHSMMVVDTQDVSITTCTVTIKTMQINSKQLTQSVFRQLPEINMIDLSGAVIELVGIPWGFVNYHWDKERSYCKHFVVQRGHILHRSLFYVAHFSAAFARLSDVHDSYVGSLVRQACSLFRAKLKLMHPDYQDDYRRQEYQSHFILELRGTPCRERVRYPHNIKEHFGMDKDLIQMAIDGRIDIPTIDARLDSIRLALIDYGVRWDSMIDRLRGVEQLFIAA